MRATKAVFKEEEFSNKYKHISSAILEDANSFQEHNKEGNLWYFEHQVVNYNSLK